METKDNELKHLESYIQKENPNIILNKTPESLIDVWQWFEDKIEMEPRPQEEIEAEIKARPDWMKEYVATKDFTIKTRSIAYDISIYFAEVMIANNPKLYWGVETKPKSLHGVNWSRLMGLGKSGLISAWPFNLIDVCMRKSLKEKNPNYLYELYKKRY